MGEFITELIGFSCGLLNRLIGNAFMVTLFVDGRFLMELR